MAIKILRMENTDDADATLEAFRLDVTTFRMTRHENLILFMGACMNPPKLAIVTSLCKGETEAYSSSNSLLKLVVLTFLVFRQHLVHNFAFAEGQVSHEQVGHHSTTDRTRHGLPAPSRHRPQRFEDEKHFSGERPRHHCRFWSGQCRAEALCPTRTKSDAVKVI